VYKKYIITHLTLRLE